jgi:hypothetical protein
MAAEKGIVFVPYRIFALSNLHVPLRMVIDSRQTAELETAPAKDRITRQAAVICRVSRVRFAGA